MGGGKTGGQQVATPPPVTTTTSVGSALDAPAATFEEDLETTKAVDKKKLGTRGLRIPLTTEKSATLGTPAGGVNL